MSLEEMGRRITSERERLGFTLEQFAVLIGVSNEKQEELERGKAGRLHVSYGMAARLLGADPLFITGNAEEPVIADHNIGYGDESFLEAVNLLRRCLATVDAFVGEGKATECPQLVAALMSATLNNRAGIHAGNMQDFVERIATSIDGLADTVDNIFNRQDEL